LYLGIILDLFSRKVIGWAISEHMDTALVKTALQMALRTRQPNASLLHHSDQGSQYTSADYQNTLADRNTQLSMSRVGNCYDNAVVESFFGALKAECVTGQFAAQAIARTTSFENIEVWYNRQRLHFTLGYLSPGGVRAVTRTLIVSTKLGQPQNLPELQEGGRETKKQTFWHSFV
jgi:transposase InsO family protein